MDPILNTLFGTLYQKNNKITNFKPSRPTTKNKSPITFSQLTNYPALSKYKGLIGKLPLRAPTTYVGVEVELEQVCFLNSIPYSWGPTDDGSLKVNGMEFVSVPIQFKYLEIELERLFKSLIKPKISSRCSTHVHLNARDFTHKELLIFILLYSMFEKSLFKYSGNRWNNNYCTPLYFHPFTVQEQCRHLKNNGINKTWYKYYALNISPIFGGESSKIGTIEFRHMVGTTNVNYIINWINLIVSLKIMTKNTSLEELEKLILNTNYTETANKVFKSFAPLLTEQPEFDLDMQQCIAHTKMYHFTNTTETIEMEI